MGLIVHIIIALVCFQAIPCAEIIPNKIYSLFRPKSKLSEITFSKLHSRNLSTEDTSFERQPLRFTSYRRNATLQPEVTQADTTKIASETFKYKYDKLATNGHKVSQPYRLIDEPINIIVPSSPTRNDTAKESKSNNDQSGESSSSVNVFPLKREVRDTSGLEKTNNSTYSNLIEIKIATVLPADEARLFSIKRVQPAIELAIRKMNPVLAPLNRTLTVKFRDSKCDIADGINEAINFYVKNEMDVLFGPCCDYAVAPCARQVRLGGKLVK